MSASTETADKIIDTKRRLGRYVRDVQKAKIILTAIAQSKKKKKRTFGAYKSDEFVGGFSCRYSLIFTNLHGNALRFEFNVNILSKPNLKFIHRAFHELIVEEELDLLCISDIKARNPKSIKDKL